MEKKNLSVRKHSQQVHFRRRVEERLGYALSEEEIAKIANDIKTGVLVKTPSQIPRLSIYQVLVGSRPCVVLFDNVTQELVTFLTLSMWQARDMATDKDQTLRTTLEDSPAGKVLKTFKEKK